MEIQTSNHMHPLVLKDKQYHSTLVPQTFFCAANCRHREIDLNSSHFECQECRCRFHYLCAEPSFQQFNYLINGQPHTLQYREFYGYDTCIVCLTAVADVYSCDTCHVNLHVKCALETPTITFESKQNVEGGKHLCHNKEMELVEIKHGKGEVGKNSCGICELPLPSSTSTTTYQAYGCRICKNFFHITCIELSPEITHPFHSSHPLQVSFFIHRNIDGGKCGSCRKTYRNRFLFFCGPCKIYICARCRFSKVPASVKYQGHDHLLHLMKKTSDDTDAVDCGASPAHCKQMVAVDELTNLQRYFFRCTDCEFDLHFLCGPLPCSINHHSHIHPLVLFDWIVEDDFGEYYCDVCESLRDPRICVYYCAKCKYFAHVRCVMSEAVRVLKDGPGDDNKLRILGQRKLVIAIDEHSDTEEEEGDDQIIQYHEIALSDFIINLRQQESDEIIIIVDLTHYFSRRLSPILGSDKKIEKDEREALESEASSVMRWILERENLWHENRTVGSGPQESESIIQLQDKEFSHFTNYEMLVEKLKKCRDTSWWTNLTFHELKFKMVNVGGYMITWNLVPVMKHLLTRNHPVPRGEQLSWKMKSLVYFLICRLLNSMSETLVVHITEPLLANWYSCLQFVEYKGFEFGFIKSRLEEVTRAYFALRLNDAKTRLREQIAHLKDKLNRHEELLQRYEAEGGTKSELLEEYSKDASRLKWKMAGHGWL